MGKCEPKSGIGGRPKKPLVDKITKNGEVIMVGTIKKNI